MRLLVVDDHEVVRRGVGSLLLEHPGYEVCGEAGDGQEALEKARDLKPDVIVMDVSMPRRSGLEATSLIRTELPECEIVLLTQHDSQEMARQALKAGARGYVIKSSMARDLISAVERVSRHEYFYDPSFAELTSPANVDVQEVIQRSAALEQALRESEQLYRSTFEMAAVGVSHVAPDGRWLRVNRRLCEIVGYSEQELLKRTFQEMTHPEDLPADLALTQKILDGELDTFSMDKRYIRKDGSLVWVNLTVAAVRHPDRKLKHFVSIVEDISERKKFEETLRDREERLRLAQQAAHVGTFESNLQTGVNRWTPELEIMHGLKPGTFAATTSAWEQLVHPEDREAVLRKVERSLLDGGDFEGEWRVVWPDGSIHWMLGRASIFKDQDGKPLRMLGVNIDITERKQAEEALRRSEAGYRVLSDRLQSLRAEAEGERSRLYELFMKSPSAIALMTGPEHRFTFINSECLRMSRRKRIEELIGKTVREAIPEVTGQGYIELLDEVYRTGVPFVGTEMPVLLNDEPEGQPEQIFVNFVFQPLRNAEGEIDAVMYHGVEITQQVQSRKRIEDSEARFRLAEAAAQVGSWEWDPVSATRKLSPELRRILAVDDTDDGVKTWGERIHAEDRPIVESMMKESARTGEMDFEYRYNHPDLGLRWLHSRGRKLGNESPMFGVVLDVTERKQAQAAASRATGVLAAIVDSSDDAIVSKNLEGFIKSWNKAAERIFGYTAEEAIGKHITLIIPQDRQEEETEILRRIRSGERVDHFETVRRRKDGTLLNVSLTISPVKDDSGRIVGASKVARDITERKRAEADLRKSEEQFRKLSETLDAEVRARTRELEERNAEILTQSEQLRELSWRIARGQEEERRHIARELHDSAGQTLTALGLSAAELVSAAEKVAPELAKRGEALQELIQQLHQEIRTASYLLHPPLLDETGLSSALGWYVQGLMERSGLSITLDVAGNLGRLPSDMELVIFRLVQECLTNIHRHSRSKTAAIRIFSDRNNVRVEVIDQGVGIAPDRLATVQSGGSGVGIRGMQERLRQFRGAMKIESNGSGTSVIATIPVVKEVGATLDAEPSQAAV